MTGERFSRRSILSLERLIQQQTELLCKRIAEFKGTNRPLSVTEMLPAFTGDIIMEYAFGFSYKQLESKTFDSFHEAFMSMGGSGHVATFFPWVITVIYLYQSLSVFAVSILADRMTGAEFLA